MLTDRLKKIQMKKIDAYWEKRNLGVTCVEVLLDKNDNLMEVKKLLDHICAEYIVVKVPVCRFDINKLLTDYRYSFIECSLNMIINVKHVILNPLHVRINKSIFYEEMGEDDFITLQEEIKKGLFNTDRIVLDDYFSKNLAASRYINWITDELAKNSQLFKIIYKKDAIGFFTFKQISQDVYYHFLAGLYEKYLKSGLGFTTIYKPIEEVLKRKGKKISTYVSTNNLPVIKNYIQQGFTVNEIFYVYIKHN